MLFIFLLCRLAGGGGVLVMGWDGMGEAVRVVYIPWNGKSLVRVVHLSIVKLFNVDQHISYKYNFSLFNFLCDGFFTIQPIRIHDQCYSKGETRCQGLLLCLHI